MGKMSPWLGLGWSHHCPLPKDRAKSGVTAEPTITRIMALPCLEPGTPLIPTSKSLAACGPGASTGAGKSHDVPQGFACAEGGHGPCVPAGESQRHPFPGGSSARQPLPDSQRDQEGAWQLHQSPMTRQAALVLNDSGSSEKPYCVHGGNEAHGASLMSNKHCASFRATSPARETTSLHTGIQDACRMLIPNKLG